MQNDVLTNGNNDQVFYQVIVNGQPMSQKYTDKTLAELEKQKLDPNLQTVAEVVTVTSDGSQLLLG